MANDCTKLVGVKNILITFRNCETDQIVGPISHKLAKDDLPMIRMFDFQLDKLTHGYYKRKSISREIDMIVIRNRRIPMADYQGRSVLKVQVEYEDGLVYTGESGGVLGDEKSDTHEIKLNVAFRDLEELLPPGALMQP